MGGQGARTKTRVYFFNIDMMYILKARLWELNAQLKLRINSRNDVGNLFICKNTGCGKEKPVTQIDFQQFGKKTCSHCGIQLQEKERSNIDNNVKLGCEKIIEDL